MKKFPLFALTIILAACSTAQEETQPIVEDSEPIILTTTSNFADMLKSGRSLECAFSSTDEGITTTGTMWIDGSSQRMKGAFARDNETYNVIVANSLYYMWGSELEQGIFMTIDPGEAFGHSTVDDQDSNIPDVGLTDTMPVDFSCKKWFIDENTFMPPTDVQFTDMTAMMKQFQNIVPNGNPAESACAACNFLPEGEDKEACLVNLQCK